MKFLSDGTDTQATELPETIPERNSAIDTRDRSQGRSARQWTGAITHEILPLLPPKPDLRRWRPSLFDGYAVRGVSSW